MPLIRVAPPSFAFLCLLCLARFFLSFLFSINNTNNQIGEANFSFNAVKTYLFANRLAQNIENTKFLPQKRSVTTKIGILIFLPGHDA